MRSKAVWSCWSDGPSRLCASTSPRANGTTSGQDYRRTWSGSYPEGRSAFAVVLQHGLDVGFDLDALPDEESSGLQGLIPGDGEVLPVDLPGGQEGGAGVPPGVDRGPAV